MQHYSTTHETECRRVRWVFDEEYRSEGSFALGSDEEDRAAVAEEREGLANGSLVVLGAIVETRCDDCAEWRERDSCWGFVVSVDTDLEAFGTHSLDIPAD